MRVKPHLRVPVEQRCEAGIRFCAREQVKESRTVALRVRFCLLNARLFDVLGFGMTVVMSVCVIKRVSLVAIKRLVRFLSRQAHQGCDFSS
jgi:hypothetical protein